MKKLLLSLGLLLAMYTQTVSACVPPMHFIDTSSEIETAPKKSDVSFFAIKSTTQGGADCFDHEVPMRDWKVTLRGTTYNLFPASFPIALLIPVAVIYVYGAKLFVFINSLVFRLLLPLLLCVLTSLCIFAFQFFRKEKSLRLQKIAKYLFITPLAGLLIPIISTLFLFLTN